MTLAAAARQLKTGGKKSK